MAIFSRLSCAGRFFFTLQYPSDVCKLPVIDNPIMHTPMKTMTRQELAEAYGIDRKTLSKRLRQADIHPRPYEPLSPAHVWAFLDHYGVPEG